MKTEYMKTKKDRKYNYDKTWKASSEMGAQPCLILLHWIWKWRIVGGQ